MTAPVVHVLGCGRAARSVLRWLFEAGQIEIGQVCNRSLESALDAVEFLGGGRPVEQLDHDITAGWLLLGLPDGALDAVARGLACRMPGQPELAFHLSGSVSSAVLACLSAPVVAVHPVRAFSDPTRAVVELPGTWFVGEGDASGRKSLERMIVQAGGRWLTLPGERKALYHAATVAASNYLVTLTRLARMLADEAGLEADSAQQLLAHLQRSTLGALEVLGPAQALTGPIERGDVEACERLLKAVDAADPEAATLFRALGLSTLDLALEKRGPRPTDQSLRRLLSPGSLS